MKQRLGYWMEDTWQDLVYANRSLRRQPGFALTAILTLGVGLGLNTTLATMFSTVYWRQWSVPQPQEMVQIFRVDSRRTDYEFNYHAYRLLADNARSISIVATSCGTSLRPGECVVRASVGTLTALFVSANYFEVLGIGMERGRGFGVADDNPNSPARVAVISYTLWQSRFAADPDIVGKTVQLDDEPFTVIGVASRQFNGETLLRRDVWLPLAAGRILRPTTRDTTWVEIAGRLAPGVSRAKAQAELQALFSSTDPQPKQPMRIVLADSNAVSRPNDRTEAVAAFVVMFLGVGLMLLLTCANVGNLFLARMLARSREIALRASIGASRGRLVRQLMTESLVLAVIAASLAMWVGFVLPEPLINLALGSSDVGGQLAIDVEPDSRVLAFTVGLIGLTCLAFGLAPALHATRADLTDALKGHNQRLVGRFPLRAVLLAGQVAISVVLLVAGSLLFRAIQQGSQRDLGFRIHDVTVVSFEPPVSYPLDRIRAFSRELVHELTQLPQSHRLSIASVAPLSKGGRYRGLIRRPIDQERNTIIVSLLAVSPGYFDVLGLSIAAGRPLEDADVASEGVLVNEVLARQLWPGESPLGRTIVSGWAPGRAVTRHVVGVVRNDDTEAMALRMAAPRPRMYEPILGPRRLSEMHVGDDLRHIPDVLVPHAASGTSEMVAALATRLDSRVRVRTSPLAASRDALFSEGRISAVIAGALGVTALILAAFGVFGVFGYIVRQQTRDIGVRIALGAQPFHVIRTVLGLGARPLAYGLAVGGCAGMLAGQILRTNLFGLSPFDPLSYVRVMVILTVAAMVALAGPAWRATRVDPLTALRCE